MMIAAAILVASLNTTAVAPEIDLSALFQTAKTTETRGATCGIKTVGYRFVGKPGQEFRYAGDSYEIPQEGSVELIAERGSESYRIDGQAITLSGAALDQFGFREVALPSDR